MSEIPSTRNGIHHLQPSRPVKRSMNPENGQREETAELLSISGSEDCTSDTLLKTPYGTEECLRNYNINVQEYFQSAHIYQSRM